MSNDSAEGAPITVTGVPSGAWFGEGTLLKRESYRYNIEVLRKSVVAGLPIATFEKLSELFLFGVSRLQLSKSPAVRAISAPQGSAIRPL